MTSRPAVGKSPGFGLRLGLGILLVLFVSALAPLHNLVPLWVEGMPQYVDLLTGALGKPCTIPAGTLRVGGVYVPLSIDAYQGPFMPYLDIPAAYLWFSGATDDLYVFRLKGIVLLALSGFLLFEVLGHFFAPSTALLSTLVFVTLPINVVFSIVDLQFCIALYFGILSAAASFTRYLQTRRMRWLLMTSFFAGMTLWTRAESLIWTAAAAIFYGVISRRKELVAWWRDEQRKRLLLLTVPAFLLGAAPVAIYNALYPRQGLLAFLWNEVRTAGPHPDRSGFLRIRLAEFLDFNLLNNWRQYQVRASYRAFLLVFAACAALVLLRCIRRRTLTFPLVAIAVVLPLSIFCNRGPREFHLLPLTLVVVAVVAEGATALSERFRPAGPALLAGVLLANLVTCGAVWIGWQSGLRFGDTLLTHSNPGLLAMRLRPYRNDALYFTNIGLYHEAVWASRNTICGKDILSWGNDRAFEESVRTALADSAQRRVFVAFPVERESRMGGRALPRSALLEKVLRSSGAAWRREVMPSPVFGPMYELFIVEKGAAPATRDDPAGPAVGGGVKPAS